MVNCNCNYNHATLTDKDIKRMFHTCDSCYNGSHLYHVEVFNFNGNFRKCLCVNCTAQVG